MIGIYDEIIVSLLCDLGRCFQRLVIIQRIRFVSGVLLFQSVPLISLVVSFVRGRMQRGD